MSGVERPTRVNVYNEAALADLLTPGPDDMDATGGSVFDTMTTGRSMQTSTRRTTRGTGNSRHAAAAAAAARRAQVQPSPGHRRRGSVASQSSMVQALVGSVIRHDPNDVSAVPVLRTPVCRSDTLPCPSCPNSQRGRRGVCVPADPATCAPPPAPRGPHGAAAGGDSSGCGGDQEAQGAPP